jgi:8-oxo-dGTP pyrophosphatase MutT (NUDIX family)
MNTQDRFSLWSDELRAIANEGLHWSEDDPYHASRYRRILRIAAEILAAPDAAEAARIEQIFADDLTHLSPYACGDAAIFNADGHILLIQRADDHLWAMPGGMFEVGETPAQGACREAWEETGIDVDPIALAGVYDSRFNGTRTRSHLYMFCFVCRPRDAEQVPVVTNETLDVRWYDTTELPPLSPGHHGRIQDAILCWRGDRAAAAFDR